MGYNIKSKDVEKLIGIPRKEIVKRLLKISDLQQIKGVLERWEKNLC